MLTESAMSPQESLDAERLLSIIASLGTPASHTAETLLFAVPLPDAPFAVRQTLKGALRYRAIRVGPQSTFARAVVKLRTAIASRYPGTQLRDLYAQHPTAWVGAYRSGTRLYTSGLSAFQNVPDVSVPDICEPHMAAIVSALLTDIGLDGLTLDVATMDGSFQMHAASGPSPSTYTRLEPISPLPNPPLSPLPMSPPTLFTDPWQLIEAAADMVAETLNAAVVPVPLSLPKGSEPFHVELLVTDSCGRLAVVPLEVSIDPPAFYLGVPTTATPPRFDVVSPPAAPSFADDTAPVSSKGLAVAVCTTLAGFTCLVANPGLATRSVDSPHLGV